MGEQQPTQPTQPIRGEPEESEGKERHSDRRFRQEMAENKGNGADSPRGSGTLARASDESPDGENDGPDGENGETVRAKGGNDPGKRPSVPRTPQGGQPIHAELTWTQTIEAELEREQGDEPEESESGERHFDLRFRQQTAENKGNAAAERAEPRGSGTRGRASDQTASPTAIQTAIDAETGNIANHGPTDAPEPPPDHAPHDQPGNIATQATQATSASQPGTAANQRTESSKQAKQAKKKGSGRNSFASRQTAKSANPPTIRQHAAKTTNDPLAGLTPKQRAFTLAYVGEANGNGTEAARRAGYAVPMEQAYENIRKPRIKAAIGALASVSLMTGEELLQDLARQARADMGDYARLVGAEKAEEIQAELAELSARGLSGVIKKLVPTKYGLSVELCDKQGAQTLIGKHLRLFVDRVEHSQGPPAIDSEAVRRALSDPRALELACELDRLISRPEPASPTMALEGPPRASEPEKVDSYHPTPTDASAGLLGVPPVEPAESDSPASTAVAAGAGGMGRSTSGAQGISGEEIAQAEIDEKERDDSPDIAPFSG
jgi:phage terminase small subunit